jgi:hypothetical protein
MMVMVVQAVVTVAFVHHSEQSGAEYVSFDHDASVDVFQADSDETEKSSLDDFGCHHCCHCTGIFSYLTSGEIYSILSGGKDFGYILELPSALISPHLRPPIL